MAAVFFVLGGFLLFVTAIRTHAVYHAILDTLPPQFQDDWTSRYAFSVYALEPTTPLDVQVSYIKAMGLSCPAFLSISLGFFAAGNVVLGCGGLLAFAVASYSALQGWNTYKSNRDRPVDRGEETGQ
ncbi:hypothetical protein [Bradyrhizobium sp. STM 3809]|uniref:hypothetical protein n=1 Tax=Bradyrhizobium sp. STM 3809 TaxID=551936 RepID=UPI00024086AD|nr:hypothetical protein [Bradyrhizobium sp. STM 3809]CCD97858.1 conserved hypothetical protein [Bradyrhizobium sp. STM 3809]